ncbi:DUF4350 domain-containing protein [Mucilaginibacter phyllosphaerae]|uniref:Unsaturated rhamnogalacturonyl hydrolase n=1 Tax=Mucilaginibacter phyllosphaerae TaxID=1812349 RepID=A0A4Y8ALF6_9SPHI|nr:DUF4350 domain-containing protein [Mucilaginibacter phyllosphaerae]MBB3967689.1 unsaturated rhamnogalacturonyl hydrolase [Mucilaginibacter phyllosphaerae]TEW69255.1 hypothetical protein E2R65_03565 [Mucilaginibacter phyllosphaerae]GGH03982.1 hypothetical protein GCM10007352_06900 [Mucilaginibacter phyllosphaerae]
MKGKFFAIVFFVCFTAGAVAQNVTLDGYFNRETHVTKDGQSKRFHYLWDDTADTGFSEWGDTFTAQGARLHVLEARPTVFNLKNTSIYIIVDPDTRKENPSPNYLQPGDACQVAKWVKAGGVLVLMANDSANVELNGLNLLAAPFGLHFNNDMQNHVTDDAHFDDGAVAINNNPVFKTAQKAFMKDVCSIGLKGRAKPVLKAANGAVIAAVVKYGKGTVFAVGDPWLYNEYVNGRLPAGFDNDKAMADLTKYLLAQAHAIK